MGSNSGLNNVLQSGLTAAPLQVLLDKLATFVQNEIALILDADDEFKKLKRAVLKVEALVDCVTTKQQRWCYSSQRAVQLWLRDLQNVLLDADDLLYGINLEFMKRDFNSDLVGLQTEDEVGKLVFSEWKLPTIPHEMAKIRGKLESMAREMDGLFMTELVNNPQPNFIENLQTSSLVNNSFMIEREDEVNNIKRMLLQEGTTDDISIISIVGMAGIGKTTLAQFVYNDEDVVNHFQNSRVWVSISIEDTVEKITNSIFVSITNKTVLHVSNLNIAQTRLQDVLFKHKFLIVLDGMWNENARDWDVLLLPFKDVAARGSKILVTTRSMIVSRIVSKLPAYHVQTLSDEECWCLIKQRALSCINEYECQEFEEIGLKIAQKCRGLPLAARVMGNILRIKYDKVEWEGVLKSKLWDLEYGANELLPTLKISYDHLPSFLKRCFSYCSIFPHSYEFKRDELVQLWIAEGFIQQRAMRRFEDIANDYFDLLLSRSFFQEHRDQSNHPIYRMHDLIHDLAQFISDGTCFRMEDNISHPLSNLKHSRHLSLLCEDIQPRTWRVFHRCGRLRTFILLSQGAHKVIRIPKDIFIKIPYIRVLNLSYTNISKLPDSIGTLKHLHHLNVSNTKIESLPESITDLQWMETIKLKNCPRFASWPEKMMNLTKLRHLELDIKGQLDSMPKEFGKLTSLETLPLFLVAKEKGQQIEELKGMNSLRGAICITNLENVTNMGEAIAAGLDQKPDLDKLELEWNITSHLTAPEVLAVLRPHSLIKELVIRGYRGVMFPAWLASPSFCKLQSIYLHKCYQCTVLPSLGELPMLKSLYIHCMPDLKIVDGNFTGSGRSFPSLLELKFKDMPQLAGWRDLTNDNMPSLCYLQIEKCPSFKFLPSLQYLSCLKTLEISNCPQVQFLPNGEVPKSLSSLIVEDCGSLLNQHDASIIGSISYVEVDGHILQG